MPFRYHARTTASLMAAVIAVCLGLSVSAAQAAPHPMTLPGQNGKIAFASNRDGGYTQIFTMNSDGTGVTDLTVDVQHGYFHPVWSPDGNRISFVSNRTGSNEIYVMDADGT